MNSKLIFTLLASILISLSTLVFAYSPSQRYSPQVLGLATSHASVYDDGNGTLYIEYSVPQAVYDAVSSWQGKYPGRTITTALPLSTWSTKYSAIIFTYIGR